ncbi:DUF1904 family protein [Spiroplasma endosymbiont of Panorpa germanica]|uniref:DUF1904 family protein n=1 Tax=Spiroplasma endosymbiont of Panorpa germanica TaxID=3066314 RepID=UPI0030CF7D52
MPIFNFYGASREQVSGFAQKIDEISQNLKAPTTAFSFWNVESQLFGQSDLIKIEINWKKRGEEMKSWISKCLQNYFSEINPKYQTIIIFNEIDDNYYKLGEKS